MIIRSACFLAALKARLNSTLNSRNFSPSNPPRTSMYSWGSLNGAISNPSDPGEFDSMKPKSISVNEFSSILGRVGGR